MRADLQDVLRGVLPVAGRSAPTHVTGTVTMMIGNWIVFVDGENICPRTVLKDENFVLFS